MTDNTNTPTAAEKAAAEMAATEKAAADKVAAEKKSAPKKMKILPKVNIVYMEKGKREEAIAGVEFSLLKAEAEKLIKRGFAEKA